MFIEHLLSVRYYSSILQVHGHYRSDVGTGSLPILQKRCQAQEVKSCAQLGRVEAGILLQERAVRSLEAVPGVQD